MTMLISTVLPIMKQFAFPSSVTESVNKTKEESLHLYFTFLRYRNSSLVQGLVWIHGAFQGIMPKVKLEPATFEILSLAATLKEYF